MKQGAYYNRGGEIGAVVCLDCGEIRWGDPYTDDRAAFDARYNDTSGDWCWTPLYDNRREWPCIDCGRPVEPVPRERSA